VDPVSHLPLGARESAAYPRPGLFFHRSTCSSRINHPHRPHTPCEKWLSVSSVSVPRTSRAWTSTHVAARAPVLARSAVRPSTSILSSLRAPAFNPSARFSTSPRRFNTPPGGIPPQSELPKGAEVIVPKVRLHTTSPPFPLTLLTFPSRTSSRDGGVSCRTLAELPSSSSSLRPERSSTVSALILAMLRARSLSSTHPTMASRTDPQ